MTPFLRSTVVAAFLWLLLPLGGLLAQSVQVKTISTDYVNQKITFSVSWAAGTRNATHLSKVWIFVDYVAVISDNTTGAWQRAGIATTPAATATAGSITGHTGWGFFLEGTSGAFSSTVTATLSSVPPKFNWCAYATDYPPNAIMRNGVYELSGTRPFTVNTNISVDADTYTGGLITTFTDATGNPDGYAMSAIDAGAIATAGQTLCVGENFNTISETSPAAGGSNNFAYRWLRNNSVISGATATTYTPAQAGTYTRQAQDATYNAGWTNSSGSWVVTVNALPTFTSVAANPATICSGGSTTLTISASGAASYSFDNGNSWQTANTYAVSPTSTIVYTAKVRSSAGCETAVKTVTVTVNALPTFTSISANPPTICSGSSTTLTISATGVASYSFDNGNSWQTANTYAVSPTSTTVYTAKVRSSAGCETAAKMVTVTVNALPTFTSIAASPATICPGGATTLTITAIGAASYSFDNGNTWLAANTYAVSPTGTTVYYAKVRSAAGCVSDSKTVTVTIGTTPTVTVTAAETICYGTAGSALTATVSGGNGNNTFTWQYSADNSTWNNLTETSGTLSTGNLTANRHYRAMVTQSTSGCTSAYSASVLKTVRPQFKAGAINTTGQTLCGGGTFNTITSAIAASGGNGGITYRWRHNGAAISSSNRATYTPTQAGTYTRQAHDGACNTSWENSSGSWIVTVNAPTFTIAANPATVCPGGSSTLTITATGAAEYSFNNGSTWQTSNTMVVSPTGTTNYIAKVRSSIGCEAESKTVTVTVNTPTFTSVTASPATVCPGGSSTLTISATGAASYSFDNGNTWQTGNTMVVSPTGTTNYTAKVRSSFGCEAASKTVSVTADTQPVAPTMSGGGIQCGGTRSITATPGSGGNGIRWIDNNSTATTRSVNTTGTYYAVSTTSAGCESSSASVMVTINAVPGTPTMSGGGTQCGGTRSITATPGSGGNGIRWIDNNSTATTRTVNTTGTYYAVSTTAAGCESSSASVTVTIDAPPTFTSVTTSPATVCPGGSTTLTINATGVASYSFDNGNTWQTANTYAVSPTNTTVYTAKVRSVAGCEAAAKTATVTVDALPTFTSIAANPATICNGSSTTLTISASSAASYSFNNGNSWQTANTYAVSPASTTVYTAKVRSAAGCETAAKTVTVTVNALPTFTSVTASPATLCGSGSTTLTINNTTNAASFSFDNGNTWQAANTYVVSPTGTTVYYAKVRSAAGCVSDSKTVTVTVGTTPTVTVTAAETICYGTAGSALTATVSGGNGNNTFTWQYSADNSAWNNLTETSGTLSTGNLTANRHYRAMVTQSTSGCTSAYSASVLKTVRPQFKAGAINTTGQTLCGGGTFNTISSATDASGGDDNITYRWLRNGATISNSNSASYTPTQAGTYTRRAHDGTCNPNFAISTGSWIVTVNTPTFTIAASPATVCPGGSSTLTITATGAASYSFDNGTTWQTSNTYVVSPTNTTVYTAKVRSATGCESNSKSVTISVGASPTLTSVTASSTIICPGGATTLTITATGAAAYSFDNGNTWQSSNTYAVSPAGTTDYIAKVRSATGCESGSKSVTITVGALPTLTSFTASPATVCDSGSSTLTITATNAASYSFDDGTTWQTANTYTVSPTNTTTYVAEVRSTAGCESDSKSVTVTVGTPPTFTSVTASPATICRGESATLTITATGAAEYSFNNGATWQTSNTYALPVKPTSTTVYTTKVRSATGCEAAAKTVTVTLYPDSNITSVTASPATVCAGSPSTLTVTATNAVEYSFDNGTTWQTANTYAVSPTSTTGYTILVRSADGCDNGFKKTVQVSALPTITSFTANPDVICGNYTGKPITLTIVGSKDVVSYSFDGGNTWQAGNTKDVYTNITATYTAKVRSSLGCESAIQTTTVTQGAHEFTVTASPATVCTHGGTSTSSTLTVTATGAGTATHYDFNGVHQMGSNTYVVSPSSTTNYIIGVTSDAGCVSPNQTVTVTTAPAPVYVNAYLSPSQICEGGSATITLVATGATEYSFDNGNTWQTSNSYVVSPSSGTYVYPLPKARSAAGCGMVFNANGGIVALPVLQLGVYPPPVNPTSLIVSPDYMCTNGRPVDVTLTAVGGTLNPGGAYEYGEGTVVGMNLVGSTAANTHTVPQTTATSFWVRIKDSRCHVFTSGVTATIPTYDCGWVEGDGWNYPHCQNMNLPYFTTHFISNQTWVVGAQTWSAPVAASWCDKTTYDGGQNAPYNSDCRNNTLLEYGHLFSWCMVYKYQETICPDGWRVPTVNDFAALDIAMGGSGAIQGAPAAPLNEYLTTWGGQLGGCQYPNFDGQGSIAFYWTPENSGGNPNIGDCLHFDYNGNVAIDIGRNKDGGFSLRCIKN